MIITISGMPGSGKTTVAKLLAKKLEFDFLSVGDLQGELAMERGLTISEMMALEKKEPWIHKAVDKKTEEVGKTRDNFVIEGWIAYHFIPHSFKIFLEVDEKIGANRIHQDNRIDEPTKDTLEEEIKTLRIRLKDADEGFKKAHGVNFLDKSQYNFILDTSDLTPDQVVEKLLGEVKKNAEKII